MTQTIPPPTERKGSVHIGAKTFSLTCTFEADTAHRLHDYVGKCANLHGHHYVFSAMLVGDVPDSEEQCMLVDFGVVKRLLGEFITNNVDHRTVLYEKDPLTSLLLEQDVGAIACPYNPTAEGLALWLFEEWRERVRQTFGGLITLRSVSCQETRTCTASYEG